MHEGVGEMAVFGNHGNRCFICKCFSKYIQYTNHGSVRLPNYLIVTHGSSDHDGIDNNCLRLL